jgi:hypothetical protein
VGITGIVTKYFPVRSVRVVSLKGTLFPVSAVEYIDRAVKKISSKNDESDCLMGWMGLFGIKEIEGLAKYYL